MPSPWRLPEMSPWRSRSLSIPPESTRAWLSLAVWEFWMGLLVCGAAGLGVQLIATARDGIITVFDFTNCYAAPPIVQPCERVAYRTGVLNAAMNDWCGALLIGVALWLLWELWIATAPKPITDEFLKLLDDSFGRDWRRPRTWPWTRIAFAYGFTLVGIASGLAIGLAASTILSSPRFVRVPTAHVDTSQRFRQAR